MQRLSVEIAYLTRGTNELVYEIRLSDNRVIKLVIHMRALGPDDKFLSTYRSDFDLGCVFVGQKWPYVQVKV